MFWFMIIKDLVFYNEHYGWGHFLNVRLDMTIISSYTSNLKKIPQLRALLYTQSSSITPSKKIGGLW
jgi:hypothetical protein